LAGFDFLQIPGADAGKFRQFVLGQTPGVTLTANVRAKCLQSGRFFFTDWHDTLHRVSARFENVTIDRELSLSFPPLVVKGVMDSGCDFAVSQIP
jgi:hypothetical protein